MGRSKTVPVQLVESVGGGSGSDDGGDTGATLHSLSSNTGSNRNDALGRRILQLSASDVYDRIQAELIVDRNGVEDGPDGPVVVAATASAAAAPPPSRPNGRTRRRLFIDDEDDDNDTTDSSRRAASSGTTHGDSVLASPHRNSTKATSKSSSEKHHDPPHHSVRLAAILQRIEQEDATKRSSRSSSSSRRRSKSSKANDKKLSKRRRVSFASSNGNVADKESDHGDVAVTFIPRCEVQIIDESDYQWIKAGNDSNDIDTVKNQAHFNEDETPRPLLRRRILVERSPKSSCESSLNPKHHETGNAWTAWIGQYPLVGSVDWELASNVHDSGMDESSSSRTNQDDSSIDIVTKQGAIDLFKLLGTVGSKIMQSSILTTRDNQQARLLALGRCVESGTVRLQLTRQMVFDDDAPGNDRTLTSVQMRVGLTRHALSLCNPSTLPLRSRSLSLTSGNAATTNPIFKRKKQQQYSVTSQDVHLVLATLFPESVLSDVFEAPPPPGRQAAAPVISAAQVYALIDNVQLNAALARRSASRSGTAQRTIPGLLPTLRPYQAEAVEWMIQREAGAQAGRNPAKEWELAWVVLGNNFDSDKSNAMESHVVPLSSWANRDKVQAETLLFCPFTGWLASSIEEARTMTLATLSSADDEGIKGGILAESMGLGKSVEVLACILSNPYVAPPSDATHSAQIAQRNLNFDRVSAGEIEAPPATTNVHVVEDMSTFGDAECDSDSDESKEATADSGSREACATFSDSDRRHVTPESDEVFGDRWTDEEILGACICGELIGFSNVKEANSVVVCESCCEPMHVECAAFFSDDELKRETLPFRYRQRFSNVTMHCRECRKDRCPCCAESLTSRATLIVTPPAILNQWEREIQRHTRRDDGQPLSVAIYDGVKHMTQGGSVNARRSGMKLMHPKVLADFDVVLMTFDALMSDLGHADDNQYVSRASEDHDSVGGILRKRKRYRIVPSPLLSITWWRVCLDEAQRVETPTAGSAQMALKLKASNRWCISGTPIGRGKLDDLFGLLLFLRLNPFSNKLWFRRCFNPSYRNVEDRIKCLLGEVLWRSTKKLDLVKEQMGVPEQVEKKILLQFSSIEKHFYHRQLEQTLSAAGEAVDGKRSGKRKTSQLNLLTDHLHKLRAACCHPQVGSSGLASLKRSRGLPKDGSDSLGSRVMTMSQILDKLIDDAKLQCEESLRRAVLHTNAMAAISKLKVEAKQRDVPLPDSDYSLLDRSCSLYLQSIQLADENAAPTLILGESSISGSSGFRSPRKTIHRCAFSIEWNWSDAEPKNDAWSKFDFAFGPARKITQLRVKARTVIPADLATIESSESVKWSVSFPKDCIFQCTSSSGEFVDVHAFTVPLPSTSEESKQWILESGFRTSKSKSWRLLVQTFHDSKEHESERIASHGTYAGLDVEFFEAAIANDPLQRLHCLHNAGLSFSSLLQLSPSSETGAIAFGTEEEIQERMDEVSLEAKKIERVYLDSARTIHRKHRQRLEELSMARNNLEHDLLHLSEEAQQSGRLADCWDDGWWNDFLVACHMYGSDTQQRALCDRLVQDLDEVLGGGLETGERAGIVSFPPFQDVVGLRTALHMRICNIRTGLGSRTTRRTQFPTDEAVNTAIPTPRDGRFKCTPGGHSKCIQSILDLNPHPSETEMFENSHCKVCKADWLQTGPMCRFCKIGEVLEDLAPDKVTMLVLNSLFALLKSTLGTSVLKASRTTGQIVERAKKFFDLNEASKKERTAAWRQWRTHLDLLNDIDELNQCKSTMRLTIEGEDLTALTAEQQLAVVVPMDVNTRFHDHSAKQAMALGALNRAKGTLQYLKNQNAAEHEMEENKDSNKPTETCILCLGPFDTDRAVLQCGHSFHFAPCLERLRARSGVNSLIHCPLRCRVQTDPKDVMIASDGKRHDDGSHAQQQVKGSFGTKVTRLISDIMDMCEQNEKGLVFSQWDDMLAICEQALAENGIPYVRVSSLKAIGECTRRFRQPDCSVMLLNVKNGAEGLTLVEATHVFMVEPLLNCGLDSQAINRTHRIGQNRKTYVWRYIVQDTVEVKIDKLRLEHQEDQLEDSLSVGKKSLFKAGGIDGGFQSQEELLNILQP